jgi:hypothetical protein
MTPRSALCGALLVALFAATACGPQPPPLYRSVGSTPIGTDASTGQPSVSARGLGPGGINRNYYIGGDPNFPEPQASGRR